MNDILVTGLVGQTIKSVDVIAAEPGRTSHRYLVITTEGGDRVIQGIPGVTTRLFGTPFGPDPSVEAMATAPEAFSTKDITEKINRDTEAAAKRKADRRAHIESEIARLQAELDVEVVND